MSHLQDSLPPVTRAMILAAGRGERMRPLTDAAPKPLLAVHGRPLIVWHLLALARAGVRQVLINTAWLGDQFEPCLGDGRRFGLQILYSHEGRDYGQALETAGGLATAWPLLQGGADDEAIWLVSGDIYAPRWQYSAEAAARFAASPDDAALWLVPNPGFHAQGDFDLDGDRVRRHPPGADGQIARHPYTYANVALVRRRLVQGIAPGQRAALGPCLFDAAARGALAGHLWNDGADGPWLNVGTPQELERANAAPAPGGTDHAGRQLG
ncbi:nucleotidyltransferase family protein [Amphibiibacter pelophylacis]|uniref:Nucleotidyltransferase family protein n=1 Tax=Amphibiibacter pelophylacis TaxID=1799477 RepID=A0ACC6NZZ2_9BURK